MMTHDASLKVGAMRFQVCQDVVGGNVTFTCATVIGFLSGMGCLPKSRRVLASRTAPCRTQYYHALKPTPSTLNTSNLDMTALGRISTRLDSAIECLGGKNRRLF